MRRSSTGRRTPAMLFGFLRSGIAAATLAVLPALASGFLAASSARADDDTVPMQFTIVAAGKDCGGCVVINAKGEFTDDTSRNFAIFIAESRLRGLLPKEPKRNQPRPPNATRVFVGFESIGGKVIPALVMGRRIRQLGWTTVVGRGVKRGDGVFFEGAGCYSACSMVMLGGVERYVVPGSKPGVHQFSPQFQEDETFTAPDMEMIVRDYGRQVVGVYDYVQEMGIDINFFIATMRAPFNSMDVLPAERWTKVGLATAMLPEAERTPVAALMKVRETEDVVVSSADKAPSAPPLSAQPIVASVEQGLPGLWTVLRNEKGPPAAHFSDKAIGVSLSCVKSNAARLEVTFRDLDPVDLEHIRAAAFSAKRLQMSQREIRIAAVSAPGRGEQALAALLDIRDLKALQEAGDLTFAVLDRSGKPATQTATVATSGAAKAIADMMAGCGGV
jgi:hypothetical protein